jgi:hypothetical protein
MRAHKERAEIKLIEKKEVKKTLPKKEEISIKPKKKKTLLELIEEEENKIEE